VTKSKITKHKSFFTMFVSCLMVGSIKVLYNILDFDDIITQKRRKVKGNSYDRHQKLSMKRVSFYQEFVRVI